MLLSKHHILAVPSDPELSPCIKNCPGCEEEHANWIQSLKTKFDSDKFWWHRYIDFYEEKCFSRIEPHRVLEFGVLAGESIKYLHERFPYACIVGVDKDYEMKEWPKDDLISYIELNQGNVGGVKTLFAKNNYDIIIDDGSHNVAHQANCLAEGFTSLLPGGFYIIEDVQGNIGIEGSPLEVIMAIEREHALKSKNSLKHLDFFFTSQQIGYLQYYIDEIHIYRRTTLPLKCHACKKTDFNYVQMKCSSCGEKLYDTRDSMSVILRKKSD